MTARIKRNLPLLKRLVSGSSPQRRIVLQEASDDLIKSIVEIAINTLRGNIPLTKAQLKRLKKEKVVIKKLCNKKQPLKKKRKTVNQKGGFIGSLLGIAIPFLSDLLTARR